MLLFSLNPNATIKEKSQYRIQQFILKLTGDFHVNKSKKEAGKHTVVLC